MTIKVALQHVTQYRYDRLVRLSPQIIRLRPAAHCRLPIQSYSLNISPNEHFINWQQDPFGNPVAYVVIPERTREFRIEVDLVTDINVINPFDFFLAKEVEYFPFQYSAALAEELSPYLKVKEQGSLLRSYLADVDRNFEKTIDFLVALNQRLENDLNYVIRLQPGVQSCEETLQTRQGSCRDMAWLLCQLLRHLGFATRFASGYLIQLKADMKSLDGPSGAEQDFSDLHAWCEVFLPGAGWIGLDPTSGLLTGEGHLPLACTPDPMSAAPITGAVDECQTEFDFKMQITRLHEDRRITKPYAEIEWQAIDKLGQDVDAQLAEQNVQLTLGGEPTFVSIDDMEDEQWTTGALGEEKRERAELLLQRLQKRFAANGILHYGQGKWYAGEALPRWCLSCFWRKDGELICEADDSSQSTDVANLETFIKNLCSNLALDHNFVRPAFSSSIDLQTLDGLEKNSKQHAEMLTLMQQHADKPCGWMLPLQFDVKSQRWLSSYWRLASEKLFLIPGDSALGFRLPLEDIDDEGLTLIKDLPERDPQEEFEKLPGFSEVQDNLTKRQQQSCLTPLDMQKNLVKTALCIEQRDERIFIFMPPINHLEVYLDLLVSISRAAQDAGLSVYFEGYPPPSDPRLLRFSVTPDPGVIEVNIHPVKTWQDLVSNTTALYEEARETRLDTQKFLIDGRQTGTGGGNHITLGGASVFESPFLRKPSVLRSLITFWQHHPSLSYLFSSLYIGPTSQAPRIDEARHDSLYELEIALQQIPNDEVMQPWLVDRLLRNLLVDGTGNTHRTEFCIDKLYSPDGVTGRQGLVEMRAFEMPPHARMSLLQTLLVRALIAHFWKHPYTDPFARWGTQLHDRFMLAHFVASDLDRVVEFLRQAGFAFQRSWFEPFLEFRFPKYGIAQFENIELELRMALEPWHVLGEETRNGATSRAVDAALERLQIKLRGIDLRRYAVTCNQRLLPLQNTGTQGEYVAGVRFKAWSPVFTLHPNLPVDSPLVFDIVDRVNQHSIGGVTYHVAHPGGRAYETFPVNANEAEARRISRFQAHGHTPGKIEIKAEQTNPEFPYTLDLRRKV